MAIVTASEYKTERGISGSDYDTILALYIEQATEEIESLCGRTSGGFEGGTFTESFDGDDSDILRVSNGPISSITSIKLGNSNQSTVDSSAYTFRDRTIMAVAPRRGSAVRRDSYGTFDDGGFLFPFGSNNVEVVYATSDARNDLLKGVAYDLIDHYLDSRGRDLEKLTEATGNTTITVRAAPDFRDRLLDKLRHWRVPV